MLAERSKKMIARMRIFGRQWKIPVIVIERMTREPPNGI
jgi:hypothetical protein